MIIITNDNDVYLQWIESNQRGYVVNANNPPNANYLVLHRSAVFRLVGRPS